MPAPLNLAGRTFGRLTAIDLVPPEPGARNTRRWRCSCSCGGARVVATPELMRGDTQSCGCLKLETAQARGRSNTKHGNARDCEETPEYRAWVEMRRRCSNKKWIGYEYYGGRGIKVCERWQRFENFLADMGPRPSPVHSIDRKDSNGNYEPSNCRWATAKEQANNRRPARKRGSKIGAAA